MLCYKYRSSRFDLKPKPYSCYRYVAREYHVHFLGLGLGVWGWVVWVSMGVLVYGVAYAIFCGVGHGSIVWCSSCGFCYGYVGELKVEV